MTEEFKSVTKRDWALFLLSFIMLAEMMSLLLQR
jgi:hypothetical protein